MNKLSPSNLLPAACLGIMLIAAVACVPLPAPAT